MADSGPSRRHGWILRVRVIPGNGLDSFGDLLGTDFRPFSEPVPSTEGCLLSCTRHAGPPQPDHRLSETIECGRLRCARWPQWSVLHRRCLRLGASVHALDSL